MSYNYSFAKGARNRMVGGGSHKYEDADIFNPHATQKHPLGFELDLNDATGRMFRYCQNSDAGILAKALMNSSAALDAEAITSTNQGASYVHDAGISTFDILQSSGNEWEDGDLVDGWLLVGDGSDAMGDMYMIKTHEWITSDTVMRVTICDEGGLRNAIVAADDIVCFQNKCANTLVNGNAQIAGVVGVSLADVAKNYYYWAQFRGYAPILVDASDTLVVGEPAGKAAAAGTPGGVGIVAGDGTDAVWGIVVYASGSALGEAAIIDLMLP